MRTKRQLMDLLGYKPDGLDKWYLTPSGYTHKILNPEKLSVETILKWCSFDCINSRREVDKSAVLLAEEYLKGRGD